MEREKKKKRERERVCKSANDRKIPHCSFTNGENILSHLNKLCHYVAIWLQVRCYRHVPQTIVLFDHCCWLGCGCPTKLDGIARIPVIMVMHSPPCMLGGDFLLSYVLFSRSLLASRLSNSWLIVSLTKRLQHV